MSQTNETNEPKTNMEQLKEDASDCGPGCACNSSGASRRTRRVLGAIIIVVAGALVARAAMKSDIVSAQQPKAEFALAQSAGTTSAAVSAPDVAAVEPEAVHQVSDDPPETAALAAETEDAAPPDAEKSSVPDVAAKPVVTEALREIAAFTELNSVAMGSAGVFIYVPAKGNSTATSPVAVMRGAAGTIEPQLRGKVGLFALKAGSPDYEQIAAQMPVPGVIALVPGGRLVPVTDEITEAKLIQAFVSSVQSCGEGGCGPSGGCG